MVMSFLEASEYFAAKAAEVRDSYQEMSLIGAAIIEKEIKNELGHYQGSVGPYKAWEQLSEATEERRSKAGFSPDDPLLVSGKLRDSIQVVAIDDGAMVGTNLEYAKDLEFGTNKIPPRPFISRSAWVKQQEIIDAQAEFLVGILDF